MQGFLDWYTFDLKNLRIEETIRGIGNAVPIPLGRSTAEGFLDSWMHLIGNNEGDAPAPIQLEINQVHHPTIDTPSNYIIISDSEDN